MTPTTRTWVRAVGVVLLSAAFAGCCAVYALPQPSYKALQTSFAPVVVSTPTPAPSARPEPPQQSKAITETRTKIDTALAGIKGVATWYDWHAGEAAAGPALRKALGANWRGSRVTVVYHYTTNVRGKAEGVTVTTDVRLTDFCGCYRGTKRERLIDLDDTAFAALAPLSRGVIRVTVEWER